MDHFKTFLRLFRRLRNRSEFGTIRFQPLLRKLHCRVQTSRKSGEICWTVETVRRYFLYFWIKEQKASHTDITVTTVDTRILILSIFESFSVEVLIPMLKTQIPWMKELSSSFSLALKSATNPSPTFAMRTSWRRLDDVLLNKIECRSLLFFLGNVSS